MFVFCHVLFRKMIPRLGMGLIVALAMTLGAERLFAYDLPPIWLTPGASTAVCDHGMFRSVPVHNTAVQNASVHGVPIRDMSFHTENWTWQMFPDGFIYPNYLAAVQNRLGCAWNYDRHVDWIWDITLGGRAPLFRYGNRSALYPEGWQLDLEGSVHLRLALKIGMDVEATDFRAGFPLSYGTKRWQVRTGYYHVSTHVGDERVLRYIEQGGWNRNVGDPAYQYKPAYKGRYDERAHRLNYYREAWLLGYAFLPTPNTRLYAEVDYAFMMGELTKPWHFQFGAEYSPRYPARGGWGSPFAALNVRLMQEHNFDGNITTQGGWQWRGSRNELFRIGLQYFAGVSDQYSFLIHRREHKVGLGVWYDF